ncbi:MAG: GDSL-type esterase/lipase family protein [Proteus mirabilis]
MTVSTELSHEEYVGNGVTTDFDFRFRIFESKHLIVVVADSEGNETTLKNGTDYTIVGAGSYNGGKVILNKPLAKGWKILLERDLPVVQETDLRNQGKFFAEVHEDAFDYLTMLIQKALGTFSLSLRKPTYLSNYYDAKGNRIANLAPPKFGSDSANKDYVDNSIKDIDSKTLRVKDKPINALPNTEQRANKILAFDRQGQPILVLPESGSASDVFLLLDDQDGFSYIGYCNSIAKLKEISPRYLYQKQPVLGFYDDTPNIGGGMFISDLSNKYYIDNWMVFPSGNSEFVWVREEKEKGRSILNCGARENDDITKFLQLAANNGWTVYQDNHYDVKTIGGINLSVGIRIVGDQITNGRVILNSTINDEIFNPDKVNDCWFKSEHGRYKGETSITNTPYVCGATMDDSTTHLIKLEVSYCHFTDIGLTADMHYGKEVSINIENNNIELSNYMSDKIISTGRKNIRGILRTTCSYSNTESDSKIQQDINEIKNTSKYVKIVIYGDSTVDGYNTTGWNENPVDNRGNAIGNSNHNLQSPNSWATQLDSKLKAINSNISVYNAGYGRKAIQDGWAIDNYDSAITNNKYYGNCDYCFIAFGLNDRARSDWNPDIYKYKYIELINFIRSKGTEPIIVSSDPTNRKDGGPTFKQYRDELIPLQKVIAEEVNCGYIDIFTYMSSVKNWTDLQLDGIHFGDIGNTKKSDYILSLFTRDNEYALNSSSRRYGSSLIYGNRVKAFLPPGGNQDIAKFSGQIQNQKIIGNHFHNTNLRSAAEADFYAGVSYSAISCNTFRNVSSKFMSLINSGGVEYLSTVGTTVNGNTWIFDDGAVNNYGIYFKGDVSTFNGNTLTNHQRLPFDQFCALWTESNRGEGGYLGSQNPVGISMCGNIVDIQCYDYNGQYWRPFESPSINYASVFSGNVFLGGSLRELAGNQNIMALNSFINVHFRKGVELRSKVNGNTVAIISNGTLTDARETTEVCSKDSSNINKLSIAPPWSIDDTGEWVLHIRAVSSPSNNNNWQTFSITANPKSQIITQSSGRLAVDSSNNELNNITFKVVVSGSEMVLTSIGGSTEIVNVTYKWVDSRR